MIEIPRVVHSAIVQRPTLPDGRKDGNMLFPLPASLYLIRFPIVTWKWTRLAVAIQNERGFCVVQVRREISLTEALLFSNCRATESDYWVGYHIVISPCDLWHSRPRSSTYCSKCFALVYLSRCVFHDFALVYVINTQPKRAVLS